jgi:tetratricopeptide (TPR) repeat protein
MPQHAKRIKIRRKALRQPDEFKTLTGEAVNWASANRGLVTAVVVVLAVAGLAAVALGRLRAAERERASLAFRAAHTSFATGNKYAEAAEAFATLARDYPRTSYGRLATLYRGHALARQGDAAGAATAYTEYLATSPEPPYLRQEALVGLGHAKEATSDATGALEAYVQAGTLDGPYRSDALLSAARLHEAAGQGDLAREIYARLLNEAPEPDVKALVRSKLPAAPPAAQQTAPPDAAAAE